MSKPCKIFIPLVVIAAFLLPAAAAAAAAPVRCQSADLRYPFEPGGPKAFGVFDLRIAGGRCPVAHRVAKAWMARFEAAFRAGRVMLARSVDGFSFTTLPAHVAQTYRERGGAKPGRSGLTTAYRMADAAAGDATSVP